jgi:hypothetical protein
MKRATVWSPQVASAPMASCWQLVALMVMCTRFQARDDGCVTLLYFIHGIPHAHFFRVKWQKTFD